MTDKKCPYIKYLFDDALYLPTGDYKCQASCRGREMGEYGEPQDWYNCDSDDSSKCPWHLKESELEEKTKN